MSKKDLTLAMLTGSENIMQNNFFIKEGALSVDDNGIMTVNFEKVTPAANKMLKADNQTPAGRYSKRCTGVY